jgi:hypothetical protein
MPEDLHHPVIHRLDGLMIVFEKSPAHAEQGNVIFLVQSFLAHPFIPNAALYDLLQIFQNQQALWLI